MTRTYRFVNDHGEIYRMTETRYRRYLLAGTHEDKFPIAEKFGVCIGTALTVNNLTPSDFSELFKKEHKALLAEILALECPECGAVVGEQCLSLSKRWENPMSRTVGIGDNGWRKTPHPERILNARAASKAGAK